MKTKKIPEIGFLRLRDVIGDKDNPGIIPVSRSSWYKGIAEGTVDLWSPGRRRGPKSRLRCGFRRLPKSGR